MLLHQLMGITLTGLMIDSESSGHSHYPVNRTSRNGSGVAVYQTLYKEFQMSPGCGWQRPAIHLLRQGFDGQRGFCPGIYVENSPLTLYRLAYRFVVRNHAHVL